MYPVQHSSNPVRLPCVLAHPQSSTVFKLIAVCIALLASSFAQQPFSTSRTNNARDGANTQETFLTPANVNQAGFGRLFSFPIDYIAMAQPLYVPNVNIPNQGTRNVIYVATQADSVYAIDASSGSQLWYASMLNGGTVASGIYLPCGIGPGFDREGIVGTPVIDTATNTMYLVAKTLLNTTVRHHLHALDISTGAERPGSPVLITATSTSIAGHVTAFNSLHQKNRPGLLLLNGVLYLAFGSNFCNDHSSGWILSYDPTTLSQLNVFNASPDWGLTSIWQAGVGLAGDESGYLYAETAECGSHGYDIPNGGQSYCNSLLKLSPDLSVADYFTPSNVAYLNTADFDLSSTGAVILPDQPGPYPHEVIASGKQGIVYVLNRDNLGTFSPNDVGVIQEVTLVPTTAKDVMFGSPAYWNNTLYFAPDNSPLIAYPLSGGMLGTPTKTPARYPGSHSPTISANGNTNGVMWVIGGLALYAFDAVTLRLLYHTNQAPNGRDILPAVGHFATQTVANGRVYVATKTSLEAYGLFNVVNVISGSGQSSTVGTTLSQPIQIQAVNPYTGKPNVGATVNFSDGCKVLGSTSCGTFDNAAPVTDSTGRASVRYTLPKKAGNYTITVSGTGFSSTTATATAKAGSATAILANGGGNQTGPVGSTLPNPMVVKAQDIYKNGVAGVTINFTANNGGVVTPASAITDSRGNARTWLTLPNSVGKVTVNASSPGFTNRLTFLEYSN